MRILLASSEVVPFAKTGGLADVCGSLPMALTALGHPTVTFMPAYRCALEGDRAIESTGIDLHVPVGNEIVVGRLLRSTLPDGKSEVYLIGHEGFFDREGLYGEKSVDYEDNCRRFIFFNRAVMEAARLLDMQVDILHANDWQTGLLPAYLRTEYGRLPCFQGAGALMTIHNLAYQGQFWHWDMLLTGLDWKYFNWHQMEFYGMLNLLKTGIVFADSINTVSPTYAQEIQTPEHGHGMEGVLMQRRENLSGILNGVDYGIWDPAIDRHIAKNYTAADWPVGKAACKKALQEEVRLPVKPDTPLFGLIGRLVDQKGIDLIVQIVESWLRSTEAQWVILGTGQPEYHDLFQRLSHAYPERMAARIGFSDELAHRIEAGADIFLMPSRFEPCGLNQLYSLKYGTVPLVRATGGLADSITDAVPDNVRQGTANGFSFVDYHSQSLDEAMRRAVDVYRHDRDTWASIVRTGMTQDWSWQASARHYVELYQTILRRVGRPVAV